MRNSGSKTRGFFLFVLLTFIVLVAQATVRLPALVGDHMVLQQESRIRVWGWGDPGEKVKIQPGWSHSWDSTQVNGDGKWEVLVTTPAAGGPFTLTIQGWNTLTLRDIMIGEVWLCSGQSNMEWSNYNGNKQIIEAMPQSSDSKIRLFHIPRTTAEFPQENCGGQWEVCGPETLKGFSALGYFFGKKLRDKMDVPVGLIMAAWGGTPVEVWTPADVIESDLLMKSGSEKLRATPWGPYRAGLLFNGMIAPMIRYEIAGTIWYQGESNTGNYETYSRTFGSMINSWRELARKNFPFYFVQIAPYNYGEKPSGALIQEQQKMSLSIPNTGMVVITDLVDNVNDIHPQNKKDVADRLANLAFDKTYHLEAAPYQSPLVQRIEIRGNELSVFFDHAPNGLILRGKKATGIYLAGEDQQFLPAEAKITGNKLVLRNKKIRNPVAVRIGFSNTEISNLFSKEGLPVCPYRSDQWDDIRQTPVSQ